MADTSYYDYDDDDEQQVDDFTHDNDPRTLGADQLLGLFVPPPSTETPVATRQEMDEPSADITPLSLDAVDHTAPTPHARGRPIYRAANENGDPIIPPPAAVQRDRSASLADLFLPQESTTRRDQDESTALLSSNHRPFQNHNGPSYHYQSATGAHDNLLDDSTSSANFFLHDQVVPSFQRNNNKPLQRMETPSEESSPSRWRKIQARFHLYPSTLAGATSTYILACMVWMADPNLVLARG